MVTNALYRGAEVSAIEAYMNGYKECECAVPGCHARMGVRKTPYSKNFAFYSKNASEHTHKNNPKIDIGTTNFMKMMINWTTPGKKRGTGTSNPPPGGPHPKGTKGTGISSYGFKSMSDIDDLLENIDEKGISFKIEGNGNYLGNYFTSNIDRHAFLIGLFGPQYGFYRSPLRINLTGLHVYHATPEKIAGHTLYAKIVGSVGSYPNYITAELDMKISIEIPNCDNPNEIDEKANEKFIKKLTAGREPLIRFDNRAEKLEDRYIPLRRFLVAANWIVEERPHWNGYKYYARISGVVSMEKQFCICEEV